MSALLITTSYGVQLLQTIGALMIVCAFAFVVLKLVARRGLGQLGNQRLQLKATLPLGQRQRVAIVRVDGVELLVGVSDQGVSLLRELPEQIQPASPEADAQPQVRFAERLLEKSA